MKMEGLLTNRLKRARRILFSWLGKLVTPRSERRYTSPPHASSSRLSAADD